MNLDDFNFFGNDQKNDIFLGSDKGVTKVSKEARETVQECVTEFLLFITSEASEICSDCKRSTIQGEDIIKAMQKLGFD